MLVGWSKFVGQMFEQPGSSVMPNMPRLSKTAQFLQMSETVTFLGSFGGDTSKEVRLFSNRLFVQVVPDLRLTLVSSGEPKGAQLASRGF